MCKSFFNQIISKKLQEIELDFYEIYLHIITSKFNNYKLGKNSKSKG